MENRNREKYNLSYLLFRTLKDIFNIASGSATCMLISIVIKSALIGVNTYVLSQLFNQAEQFLSGKNISKQLIMCCCILGIVNLLHQLMDAVFTENMVKVDATILYQFKIELSKKCTRLPLIIFEDFNSINELERAKQCLQNTRLSDLSLSFFNIMSEVISVISVSIVLASFDPWLIPISLISVVPYIVIRIIRGTQFYELKWFQAKKQRRKDYLFRLFSDKRSMKEIRIMKSSDYLENKWEQVRDEINEEVWEFKKKDIKVGETVAILGENGSGKTTLTKIIMGLYQCMEGEILFDGVNINSIKRDGLYGNVSMVSQNFTQYNLSLKENILFRKEADKETEMRIREICERVGLEVGNQGDGLETLLGREFGGVELSQGQWQKIAIARVLVKETPIVFLDEPTSALDPIIENKILTEFLRIVKGRTAIIISHRVGLCKDVDKIVVMKDGSVAEIGSHFELMKNKSEYYKLYTAQNKWYI